MKYWSITLCIGWLLSTTATGASLEPVEVAPNVYAIVGDLGNRSAKNLGNNATFGLIVTADGAVLIDSGGTYQGAQAIHRVVRQLTDQPVKWVINTGGQDHRWFGNDYFSAQGAQIISSRAAREDHQARLSDQVGRMSSLVGDDIFAGTRERYADRLFDDELDLKLAEVVLKLRHVGQAHTPGDLFVWLPAQRIMFSGDIVYVERMLGVGAQSHSGSWIKVFEAMAAYQPEVVVPGHGHPVSLDGAKQDTYQYLLDLRQRVGEFLEADGDASDIGQVDMTDYQYLLNYASLSGRNALKVYTELEWE
jgi:glyoxylase-like metal-dependent hydrolase (beta-lactamase superfamily II)